MYFRKSKVVDINEQKGEDSMKNNSRKEEEAIERIERFKSSMKVIAVVSIGAGLYGYRLGKQSGYRKGAKDGYITAGQEMVAAWKNHANELKLSRGI